MNEDKVLAIIPARGGSKGLPRKNIRELCGKPMIAWTIEAAKKSNVVDRVICSTDDIEIANIAKTYGCEVPFMRHPKLAKDNISMVEVVLDVLEICTDYGWFILLQPTSPLRTCDEIDNAFMLCKTKNSASCSSVCESVKSPYWTFDIEPDCTMRPILGEDFALRRQDLPKTYYLNGAVYICKVSWFKKNRRFVSKETIAFKMTKHKSIDIDSYEDFLVADKILSSMNYADS